MKRAREPQEAVPTPWGTSSKAPRLAPAMAAAAAGWRPGLIPRRPGLAAAPAAAPPAQQRHHAAVRHYAGRPLAARPPPGERSLPHGRAPPLRVHRTGGLSRTLAKKADPATPPLRKLVARPLGFFHSMRDNDGFFSATKQGNLVAELGASNPSLLLSIGKELGHPASAIHFRGRGKTSTGRWHHGHSEWSLVIAKSSPIFYQSVEAATGMPVKGARAELLLQLLELDDAVGLSQAERAAERRRLRRELSLLNGTGPASWWAKHNSIKFQELYDMTPSQVANYVGGLWAANGGSYLLIDERQGTATPRAFIALGRDGPGVLFVLRELLGFGQLSIGERARCHGLPPSCQYTDMYFLGEKELTKFFALVNGEAVDLACGHVPATACGLPRTVGKLLKLRVLLEYAQQHQKVRRIAAGGGGRPPGRFTMAYKPGCWWGDANHWDSMHAELYPGEAIPDWEH